MALSLTTGRVRYSFTRGRKRQQDIYLSLSIARRWPKWRATRTRPLACVRVFHRRCVLQESQNCEYCSLYIFKNIFKNVAYGERENLNDLVIKLVQPRRRVPFTCFYGGVQLRERKEIVYPNVGR